MKLSFSERHGHKDVKGIQVNSMDESLRIRLTNYVRGELDYLDGEHRDMILSYIGTEGLVKEGGFYPEFYLEALIDKIKNATWHDVYSILEFIVPIFVNIRGEYKKNPQKAISNINRILEMEKAGYKYCSDMIIPVTNENEVCEIIKATETKYESVNTHITKALKLYADRVHPDYENSIKESISAVEAMCCIIMGNDKATLKPALDRLGSKGINIHPAQKEAFKKLYGYTSDENGIRHAGIDFVNVSSEDANFMLVSCSSFVNYLIQKYEKTV